MQHQLLILRHGKSDWDTDARTDFERPLAKRGRKAVKRMGHWIAEHGPLPDHVVSSTAERARQTALRFCRAAGIPEIDICWEPAIYEASLQTLLEIARAVPAGVQTALLVGHNPGLDDLVRYLGDASIERCMAPNLMPTTALAHLGLAGEWSDLGPGSASVLAIHRPREIFVD